MLKYNTLLATQGMKTSSYLGNAGYILTKHSTGILQVALRPTQRSPESGRWTRPNRPELAYLIVWRNKRRTSYVPEYCRYMTTFSAGNLKPLLSETRFGTSYAGIWVMA
jgi:hypothetical protein